MEEQKMKIQPKAPVHLPLERWKELISKQKCNDKTIEQFCKEVGVSKSSFNANRKKLYGGKFLEIPFRGKSENTFELKALFFGFRFLVELKKV